MKTLNFRAFSFVELLISVTILALLWVVGYTAFQSQKENSTNTLVSSHTRSLENALWVFKQDNNTLPMPSGNNNFYWADTSYSHSYENENTFWVHGFITQDTLSKKYIDVVPLDPRTNSYYGYGKTKNTHQYQIASVIFQWATPQSYVVWDYDGIEGPRNLVREYNGPYFIQDGSKDNFAYNPYERILTARISEASWSVTINWQNYSDINEIKNISLGTWDTVIIPQNQTATLYFSDGTKSILWDESQTSTLTLQNLWFTKENNLITKIQLVLESGMIWNKAAHLDDESLFEIYTTDSTAAVRGTIFGVQKNSLNSRIIVKNWSVYVARIEEDNLQTIKQKLLNQEPILTSILRGTNINLTDDQTQTYIEVNDAENIKWVQIDSESWDTNNSTEILNDTNDGAKDDILFNHILLNDSIDITLEKFKYSAWSFESVIISVKKNIFHSSDEIILTKNNEIFNIIDTDQIDNNFITNNQNKVSIEIASYLNEWETTIIDGTDFSWSMYDMDFDIDEQWSIEYQWTSASQVIWFFSKASAESIIHDIIWITFVQHKWNSSYFTQKLEIPLIETNVNQDDSSNNENNETDLEIIPNIRDEIPDDEDNSDDDSSDIWDEQDDQPGIPDWSWISDWDIAYSINGPHDIIDNLNISHKAFYENYSSLPWYCNIDKSNKTKSLCIINDNIESFYLDNKSNHDFRSKDYVKLQNIDIWSDFQIQAWVYWKDLNRDDTNYYYLLANDHFYIKLHNEKLYINWFFIDLDWLEIADNKFYEITIKQESDSTVFSLSWSNILEEKTIDRLFWFQSLYLWSSNSRNNQWNWWITHVKILTKLQP